MEVTNNKVSEFKPLPEFDTREIEKMTQELLAARANGSITDSDWRKLRNLLFGFSSLAFAVPQLSMILNGFAGKLSQNSVDASVILAFGVSPILFVLNSFSSTICYFYEKYINHNSLKNKEIIITES